MRYPIPSSCLLVLALALVHPVTPLWAARGDKDKSSRPAPVIPTGPMSSAAYWSDPAFLNSFMGTYGFVSELEPKLNTQEERDFYFQEEFKGLLAEDPAGAARQLETFIRPETSAVFNLLAGSSYFRSGDVTNAVRHYEVALAKFPRFLRAHKALGMLLAQEQRPAEALPHLIRTVEMGGADSQIFGLLGSAHLSLSHFVSAEMAFRNAVLLDPAKEVWRQGLVKCLVEMGSFDSAFRLLEEMIAQNPGKASLWTLQAGVCLQMERPELAAVSLEMLRKLGVAEPKNLMLLGDIYMTQESEDLALQAYLEAIQKEGVKDITHALRAAEVLVGRGAWDQARQLFAEVRKLAEGGLPEEDEKKLLKLESKVALASGSGEEAIQVLDRIISRDPLDGEALLLAGDYHAGQGEVEQAQFRYDLAAKIQGFEPEAYVKQAQLLVREQKYTQAIELLRKAQRLKPRDNVQRFLEKVEQAATRTVRS